MIIHKLKKKVNDRLTMININFLLKYNLLIYYQLI